MDFEGFQLNWRVLARSQQLFTGKQEVFVTNDGGVHFDFRVPVVTNGNFLVAKLQSAVDIPTGIGAGALILFHNLHSSQVEGCGLTLLP